MKAMSNNHLRYKSHRVVITLGSKYLWKFFFKPGTGFRFT